MSGFLSEGMRDVIAVIGLILTILQIIMAIASSNLTVQSLKKQLEIRSKNILPNIKIQFRIWNLFRINNIPEEIKTEAKTLLLTVPLIFLIALISPNLEAKNVGVLKTIIGIVLGSIGFIIPFIQGLLLSLLVEFCINKYSFKIELFKNFFSRPEGLLIIGLISFCMLRFFLGCASQINKTETNWLRLMLMFYGVGGSTVFLLIILAVTIETTLILRNKLSKGK